MKIHIVKKGDSLYELGNKYRTSVEELAALNPHIADPARVEPGTKVKLPSAPKPVEPPASEYAYKHIVQQGDTLWKLGKAWDVPLQAMIQANPQLKNPSVLMTGEVVYVPKAAQTKPGEPAVPVVPAPEVPEVPAVPAPPLAETPLPQEPSAEAPQAVPAPVPAPAVEAVPPVAAEPVPIAPAPVAPPAPAAPVPHLTGDMKLTVIKETIIGGELQPEFAIQQPAPSVLPAADCGDVIGLDQPYAQQPAVHPFGQFPIAAEPVFTHAHPAECAELPAMPVAWQQPYFGHPQGAVPAWGQLPHESGDCGCGCGGSGPMAAAEPWSAFPPMPMLTPMPMPTPMPIMQPYFPPTPMPASFGMMPAPCYPIGGELPHGQPLQPGMPYPPAYEMPLLSPAAQAPHAHIHQVEMEEEDVKVDIRSGKSSGKSAIKPAARKAKSSSNRAVVSAILKKQAQAERREPKPNAPWINV